MRLVIRKNRVVPQAKATCRAHRYEPVRNAWQEVTGYACACGAYRSTNPHDDKRA